MSGTTLRCMLTVDADRSSLGSNMTNGPDVACSTLLEPRRYLSAGLRGGF